MNNQRTNNRLHNWANKAFSLSVLLALSSVFAMGCGGTSKPVNLTGVWPSTTFDEADYYETTESWTRHGQVLSNLSEQKQQVLEVYATLKSPEWQAAYNDFLGIRERLPKSEVEERCAAARATDYIEIAIFMSVDDRRSNDLHKGKRSTWRIALLDDEGREVEPTVVKRDRRPDPVIRTEFPHYTTFQRVYLARFPNEPAWFGPERKRIALKIVSPRGGLELEWTAIGSTN